MNESHVVHGTITRYRVRNGEIGLAWDENKPVFVDRPDIYEVKTSSFLSPCPSFNIVYVG